MEGKVKLDEREPMEQRVKTILMESKEERGNL